jgi:hypothetical protein
MGLLETIREQFEEVDRAELDNRARASKSIKFRKGDQWDDTIKAKRKAQDLPCTVYNQCDTLISRVKGSITSNLPLLVVLPEEQGDAENATNIQKVIKHIEKNSKFDSIIKDTAGDILDGGFGYWRILNEDSKTDMFGQEIVIKRIHNRFNVYFDPSAMEDTFEDAQYCFISEMMKREKFDELYPGRDIDSFFEKNSEGNFQDKWFYNGKVRVAEYFWKKPTKKNIAEIFHINGQRLVVELNEEVTRQFLEDNDYTINDTKEVDSHEVWWAKVTGEEILEGPTKFESDFIPVIKAVGKRLIVEGRQEFYSLIENVIAPQSLLNYALTTESLLVGTQSKAHWLSAEDLIEGREDVFAKSHQENVGVLTYTRNPIHPADKPEIIRPPSSSQGFINLIEYANRKIEETSGVTEAFLGQKSNEVSGRAIALRAQSSESVVSDFSENLITAVIYSGKILINMIGKIYSNPGQYIRIIGEGNTIEFLQLNPVALDDDGELIILNDISRPKYDYVIDAAATHKTKRRENVANLLQIYQLSSNNPAVQAVILPEMVRNMDIEDSANLADSIAQALGGGTPQGSAPNALAGDLNEQAQARGQAVNPSQ